MSADENECPCLNVDNQGHCTNCGWEVLPDVTHSKETMLEQIMTEYSKAKEDSCWEEDHPIFKLAEHNDTLQATIADKDAEIARLKDVLEGIVYDYDVCQNVPAARRDRVYYEAAKEALAINPIGDKHE